MENNDEDLERLRLLDIVHTRGINGLTRNELERLHDLIEKKDYTYDKKDSKVKVQTFEKDW